MPTYEYQCKNCDHRFEVWQKMVDEPLKVCPECSGTIRRILFPAGIVFKGSGFYKTDHGSGAPVSETNHNEPAATKENASKTESTGESTATPAATGTTTTTTEKASTPAPTGKSKVSAAAD